MSGPTQNERLLLPNNKKDTSDTRNKHTSDPKKHK